MRSGRDLCLTATFEPKTKEAKERSKQLNSTPIQKKPEETIQVEWRVGFFALVAFMLLTFGWSWLKSFSTEPPQRFGVRFSDVAGLANNAPVNLNGVRVGVVEKIDLKSKNEVIAKLKITTTNVPVTEGSKITIQTLGLVGAKYIEINLPDVKEGEAAPAVIPPESIVEGENPVRTELYLNKIATNFSSFTDDIASKKSREGLKNALEKSGTTMASIQTAAEKMDKNMEKLSSVTDSLKGTSDKFGNTSTSATRFFDEGASTLKDVKGVSSRMKKILDNPALTTDLKETAQMAKETSEQIKGAINQLTNTLQDKPLREDMINMMTKLNNSTESVASSMRQVDKLVGDQGLRSDLKQITENARDAVVKANKLVTETNFGNDATSTMASVKKAANNVDTVAKQLNQVLNKRSPLFQMMFGTPGRLKEKKVKEEKTETKGGETKKTTIEKTTTEAPKAEPAPQTINTEPVNAAPVPGNAADEQRPDWNK